MKRAARTIVNLGAPVLLVLLGVGAWECSDGAPKSQCVVGSQKATHSNGKTKLYECHNNEWIRVTCFNGTKKYEARNGKSIAYVCRSNEWVKQ